MTIKQIFDLGIKLGRQADWSSWSKNGNSYADSAIHYGRPNQPVKKIMAGIDIKGEELLLAWAMNDIDLVIAHHAVGKALARLAQVMDVQTGILKHYGVPLRVAKKLINSKKQFNARKLMYLNHDQVVDYARLINIPLMNLHTPTDNLAADFLCQLVKTNKPQTFASLIKVLGQVPEFKKAKSTGAGLVVFSGQRKNKCQKIFIDCTGGMPGPIEVYQELKKADVDTVVACRQSEEHRLAARGAKLNVVITGHISTDCLGMNLFLDELEKRGLKIVPCSGLTRFSRLKRQKS